jgi:DNA ligase-1
VLLPVQQYDPVRQACWAAGQPVPYLHLARAFQAIDTTTKRLKIGDALTNMFR